jgi:hypothetical protein
MAPEKSAAARARASSDLKSPLIWACPPNRVALIVGADMTTSSTMMAN